MSSLISRLSFTAKCDRIILPLSSSFMTSSISTVATEITENEKLRQQQFMQRGLPKQKPIKGVKHILCVASGKGGVGKSTVSVNLANALKIILPDKEIGILDADIFGPTVPLMMNLADQLPPLLNDENLMEPLINYGIKCMSMGFLVDQKSPVIWRGLMVMSAIDKLLRQVAWDPLDYLIIDTPPGTGDTLLSLIQNLPLDGVLIVTTPQKAALDVAERGAKMFQKMNVPIVGVVENMTSVICPQCSAEITLFNRTKHNNNTNLSEKFGVPVLQKFPLNEEISECGDSGKPIVLSQPNSKHADLYKDLAKKVMAFFLTITKES